MEASQIKRRLTSILAADAVSYSKLASLDEEGTLRVLAAHRAVIDGVIAFHDGRIVGTAGDSVLAEFPSAVEAVRCAVEIQSTLRTRNDSLPEDRRMYFRIGVNVGDVVVKGTDLLGDGVNIAARLESIAEPGGIVISSSVYDQITGKLDLGFEDIGAQRLKNITHSVRAFRISDAGRTLRRSRPSRPLRRWLPWVGAMIVLGVAVAVGLQYRAPWETKQGPAPPVASMADPERARLERQVAEAEEARRKAEIRAGLADEEARRARAQSEAQALKAKAQANAAAAAKAAAEPPLVRPATPPPQSVPPSAPSGPGTADGSAGRAGGSVATGAVVPDDKRTPQDAASDAVAVTAQPKGLAPGRLDGRWIGHLACGRYEDIPAGSRKIPFSVVGGHFVLEWGPQGNPGFGHVEGSPSADGTLTLRGTVIAKNARNLGKTVGARFDGNPTAQGFDMRGQIGRERSCSLSLVRSQ